MSKAILVAKNSETSSNLLPKMANRHGLIAGATGNFNIQTASEVIRGICHHYCKIVQRGDGYCYLQTGAVNGNSRGQVGSRSRIASQSLLTTPTLSLVFHAQI